jgi:hypothetical protein
MDERLSASKVVHFFVEPGRWAQRIGQLFVQRAQHGGFRNSVGDMWIFPLVLFISLRFGVKWNRNQINYTSQ